MINNVHRSLTVWDKEGTHYNAHKKGPEWISCMGPLFLSDFRGPRYEACTIWLDPCYRKLKPNGESKRGSRHHDYTTLPWLPVGQPLQNHRRGGSSEWRWWPVNNSQSHTSILIMWHTQNKQWLQYPDIQILVSKALILQYPICSTCILTAFNNWLTLKQFLQQVILHQLWCYISTVETFFFREEGC